LQLGFFLEQRGRDYVILERAASAGAFFHTYPRHRQLISINKRHTGHRLDEPARTPEFDLRHDWNSLVNDASVGGHSLLFTNYSKDYLPQADDLVRYLEDFASEYRLNVQYNSEVSGLRQEGQGWRLTAGSRPYACGVAIVATGLSTPHIPKFKGAVVQSGPEP
jgi:cation diffusion facilitator CzcD-associated flavoprotein CzcO